MLDRITRQDSGGLCTLTLNRPDKLNALDTATFEALEAHLTAIEQDDRIGCVLLRGAGRAFCAGADLKAMGQPSDRPPTFKPGVIERLGLLRKPVVAAVHGVCFTGGLELVLACDFILADRTARFADTHGKWGLVGAWGMAQRLPRRIGLATAKRMMMTGCELDAAEAKEIGLVDLLAPEGELDALVQGFVDQLLGNSWFTNVETKRLILATDGMPLSEALAYAQKHYPGFAPDHQERIDRFRRR